MKTWYQGAFRGALTGIVVALFDLALFSIPSLFAHLPWIWPSALEALGAQTVLGALLGGLTSPLLERRRGPLLHQLALSLLFFVLWWIAALPGGAPFLWMSGPLLSFPILSAGRRFLSIRPRRWVMTSAIAAVLFGPALIGRLTQPRVHGHVPPMQPPMDRAPDVLLIVLDTERASNFSALGYPRTTTPHFDALAASSALFTRAIAPATWSLPSHASLFTGVYPDTHGARADHFRFDSTLPTMAEILRASGYETRCFSANPWISAGLGLERGFSSCDRAWMSGDAGHGAFAVWRLLELATGRRRVDKGGHRVVEHLIRWMDERPPDGPPAFVFVNFLEAHFPHHQLPQRYIDRFTTAPVPELRDASWRLLAEQFGGDALDPAVYGRTATDLYDAGIRYTDDLMNQIIERYRQAGRLDDTIVIILADHGELVGEHGAFGHGSSMYEPLLHVPLLMRYPAKIAPGVRVDALVSTVGVLPTLLDLLNIRSTLSFQGQSLLPLIHGSPHADSAYDAPVISERFSNTMVPSRHDETLRRGDVQIRVLHRGDWKYLRASTGEEFLFNLADDPGENVDLSTLKPDRLLELRAALDHAEKALHLSPVPRIHTPRRTP